MSDSNLINLNNCDFYNTKEKLNSPRSLEACYRLGIDVKDLYYKDFHQFKLDNPDILALSKDSQLLRWEHNEKRRKEYIQALFEVRQKMKDEEETNHLGSYYSSKGKSKSFTSIVAKENSTAIEMERKALEILKEKQKQEIKLMIENEIRTALIKERNDKKIANQLEKEELAQKSLMIKRKEEEREKKRKEKEKQLKLQKDLEEQERLKRERFEEEQFKLQMEKVNEIQRIKEAKKKEKEKRKKQDAFQKKTERIFMDHEKKIKERQQKMEEQEIKRREMNELQNQERINQNNQKKETQKRRKEIAKANLENKLMKQHEDYLIKQQVNEEKRKEYELLKQNEIKIINEERIQKELEIKKVAERNKLLEQQKKESILIKHEKIEREKEFLERINQEEEMQRKQAFQEKQKKLIEAKKRSEIQELQKTNYVLAKINEDERRLKEKKENDEREAKIRQETMTIKLIDKRKEMERMNKIKEVQKEQAFQAILEKNKSAEEFKKQKIEIMNQKKAITNNINKSKKEVLQKFEELVGKNKEFSPETILQIFPGEEGKLFLEKIKLIKNETLKKSKSSIAESEMKTIPQKHLIKENKAIFKEEQLLGNNAEVENKEFEHINMPETNEIKEDSEMNRLKNLKKIESKLKKEQKEKEKLFKEEEIIKKVENYKANLTKDLVNFLSEEKLLEEERDKLYNNCENPVERKRLEKIISMERAASSQKIIDMNKEIEKKIKLYEEMLRK